MNGAAVIAAQANDAPLGFDSARIMYEMAKADAEAPDAYDLSDDECSLLGTAQSKAASAVMLTPAPNHAALAYKLETFDAEYCFDLIEELRRPLFEAIVADVRRLGRL